MLLLKKTYKTKITQKTTRCFMKKLSLLSVLLLSTLSFNLHSQAIQPTLDCTEGIIVINGQVVGSGMWCSWVYTPQYSHEVIDDDSLPPGGTLVSQACYAHRNSQSSLPNTCRNFDPGGPNEFNWNFFFMGAMKSMLCSVTSCSNPVSQTGAFQSNSDNLAYQILTGAGRTFWNTRDAGSVANVVMPIIHQHCQTLPEFSFFGYDQQACYSNAIAVMQEMSPQTYSAGLNWLNSININGVSINVNGPFTNFGQDFFDRVSDYAQCAAWHDRLAQLCPSQ